MQKHCIRPWLGDRRPNDASRRTFRVESSAKTYWKRTGMLCRSVRSCEHKLDSKEHNQLYAHDDKRDKRKVALNNVIGNTIAEQCENRKHIRCSCRPKVDAHFHLVSFPALLLYKITSSPNVKFSLHQTTQRLWNLPHYCDRIHPLSNIRSRSLRRLCVCCLRRSEEVFHGPPHPRPYRA